MYQIECKQIIVLSLLSDEIVEFFLLIGEGV
jgi:hypothetical protein